MNIIDNLEIAENKQRRKDEMKRFEFFECDDCGKLCEMPIEQHKTYTDDFILNAKYLCKKCTLVKKDKFIKLREEGKTNEQIRVIFNLNNVQMYKKINDWGLKGWKPNKPEDAQHTEPKAQHSETKTQHNEPLDHLREVKEMVSDDQVTEVIEMVSASVNQTPASDTVNHPPHYTSGSIECIDAIEAAVEGLEPQEAVCVGNVLKYVWRFKKKNGKQDLLKAEWFLKRLIDKQGD